VGVVPGWSCSSSAVKVGIVGAKLMLVVTRISKRAVTD
jgi:hypothetical protein